MKKAFILLGGNLGERAYFLRQAIQKINELPDTTIIQYSSVYETSPWGFKHENDFLNQVIAVKTLMPPVQFMGALLETENQLGRKRNGNGYEGRNIDIDMLFYGETVMNTHKLKLPHPRLHLRNFTLIPLNEIAPNLIHPIFQKTIRQLMIECPDTQKVNLFHYQKNPALIK